MCGIVGWIAPERHQDGERLLRQLTDTLAHRGPDGDGHWLGLAENGKHQIALGHRRLAIIDLKDEAAQPMWSADRRLVCVFNGEIYNYIELKEELGALGHVFTTTSDTEVLLAAYRQWGTDALPRLRGMFAVAIWDLAEQSLLLARDAFGKKPLFLAEHEGALVFGSEIEAVLGFPGISRRVEPQALEQYLLNRYVPAPLTFFAGVRKLDPGSYLVWQGGRIRARRYFTPPLATTEPDFTSFDAAVEQFSAAFDEAVRIRMRSDAPFGMFLSGGLDSSAVLAHMVRHTAERVRTFSVGFPNSADSETDYARHTAAVFGTDHSELVVTPDDFFANWSLAVRRRGAPVSEPADIPILLLAKLASSSVKMVLTGEGSDEVLGGYPKHRAEPWISLYHRLMPLHLGPALGASVANALPYRARRLQVLLRAAGERDPASRLRMWFGGMSSAERDALLGRAGNMAPPDGFPYLNQASALRRTLFFDQTSWLPDNLLERGDRMMMAGSIEGRMPFMDVELAKLAARLPDSFLIGGSGGKQVLRAAMRGVLPQDILTRRKNGFKLPLAAWFRNDFRDRPRELLTSEASTVAKLCSRPVLEALVNDHIEGRRNNDRVLWSLTNLEMFIREYRPEGLEAWSDPVARPAAHDLHLAAAE